MKPLIIYVSGAPGSGKTTLARIIGEQLYIPNISSDLIHGGIALTNSTHDRRATLQDVFVPIMINLSKKGVSFVVDQVLQKELSETDIIDRLRPHAEIINIHTICSNPIERYRKRIEESSLPSIIQRRDHLLELASKHNDNLSNTREPLELSLPVLIVNTDNGYKPTTDEVIEFILDNRKS